MKDQNDFINIDLYTKTKRGVILEGLKPEMTRIIHVINWAFETVDKPSIITSALDGKHKKGSLHYIGLALDLRINHLSGDDITQVINYLHRHLFEIDERYQVIKEPTHIHIEYDRRLI